MAQGWSPGQPPLAPSTNEEWSPGQVYGPPSTTESSARDGRRLAIIVAAVLLVIAGAVALVAYVAATSLAKFKQSAGVVEAKNTINAISRQVVAAYEREYYDYVGLDGALAEDMRGRLCASATPVPANVPKGTKYQPRREDFETGSASQGWRCLSFGMTDPMRFQYEYRVGGDYKGPKRGGPDPGPDGFEVSAEGDLDGDGNTSLFTLVGHVNDASKTVKRGELWSIDPDE